MRCVPVLSVVVWAAFKLEFLSVFGPSTAVSRDVPWSHVRVVAMGDPAPEGGGSQPRGVPAGAASQPRGVLAWRGF